MNNHTKPESTEREVPKKVGFVSTGLVLRPLTLKEQWLIANGYSLAIEIQIATQHNPGTLLPCVTVRLTGEKTMDGARIDVAKRVLAAKSKKDKADAKYWEELKKKAPRAPATADEKSEGAE